MADVFWLGELSLLASAFSNGLRSLALKPEWIQEAHVLGQAPELPIKTLYRWPGDSSAAHRLLHFACQALESGDLDLLLLASGQGATVLASPDAVGRWNLLPRASLSACFSYPPDTPSDQFLSALAYRLATVEIEPAQDGYAAALGEIEFSLAPAFPAVKWLPRQVLDLTAQLNRVCAALENQPANLGLLFSAGLATVIERL
ncbi:MAG TPA: hypothetical protein VN452_03825 [Longilinea sp.]|nr:hypothetical protein [Longilinea sp.]